VKIYSSEVSGSLKVRGDIFAENYIVKSTVSTITQSFSSGSTLFGDSNDDTHQFTGSLSISGSTSDVVTITGGTTGGGSNSEILKIKAPSTGHYASFGVSDDGSERVQIKAGTSSGLRNLELTNILQLKFMSNEFGILGGNRANSYLQAGTSRGIIFNTNDSNRALFLDASQNAEFSGNISGSSTSTGSFGSLISRNT
jgi:hypothetical protein